MILILIKLSFDEIVVGDLNIIYAFFVLVLADKKIHCFVLILD